MVGKLVLDQSINKAFDLQFSLSYTVRFVPMEFSPPKVSVCESDGCGSLEFSPPTGSELLLQSGQFANAVAACDWLDILDASLDLEVHRCFSIVGAIRRTVINPGFLR
jgi:hypothetical protein